MSKLLEVGGQFPWVHEHICPPVRDPKTMETETPFRYGVPLVALPDGRIGVIDHFKSDGNFGVRPIDSDGQFLPNTSEHWTTAQRRKIPEEVAVAYSDLKVVPLDQIPPLLRKGYYSGEADE